MYKKFEIGEVIDCKFEFYKKAYALKCEIIELIESHEDEHTQTQTQVTLRSNQSAKRERPLSTVIDLPSSSKKLTQVTTSELASFQLRPTTSKKNFVESSESSSDCEDDESENSEKSLNSQVTPKTIENENSQHFKPRKIKPKYVSREMNLQLTNELDEDFDFSVEQMLEMAKTNKFPKKNFFIGK